MFVAKSIRFLVHVVGNIGIKLDPKKVKVVLEFFTPRSITNVRAFLGLINHYNNYVKEYARIVIPLFELTKWDIPFHWSLDCQKAFE